MRFTQTLMLEGLTPSVGTVGDAYDNALAETTIGLYKTECIRAGPPFRAGPIRSLADLEEITSAWPAGTLSLWRVSGAAVACGKLGADPG